MKKKLGIRLLFVLLAGALVGGAGGVFFYLVRDLPEIRNLENYNPDKVTNVYSADNVLVAKWYAEKRQPVSLSNIPGALVDALIASEDRSFYRHFGVDLKGLARAFYSNIKTGKAVQGGSTLTQQLAKNLFLTPEKTYTRKLKEAILAFQLERRYTKDEILEFYLNHVYFGSGAHGVKSAAETFFGKSLDELTLGECALIVGVLPSPSNYSPLVSREKAKTRRDRVLFGMKTVGSLSSAEYESAIKEPLVTAGQERTGHAPYFMSHIRRTLEQDEDMGERRLYRGGLTVHTTLNMKLQKFAEKAVKKGMEDLAQRIEKSGQDPEGINAALVCLDVRSGAILAMVGGVDYEKSRFNRATMAKRQPGSAMKPLVFAVAVEQGMTQSDQILDAAVAYDMPGMDDPWAPENFSKEFSGEISLRHALAKSKNVPAVRLASRFSPAKIVDFSRRVGIRSKLAPYLSLALGSFEVDLLELTAAYAVFPRAGTWTQSFVVTKVLDNRGRMIKQAKSHPQAVITPGQAAIMVDMLQAVVMEGTGKKARNLPGPLAGKTGTTNECRDAWFVGFSPGFAVGVWVGYDDGRPLGKYETGARAALPIWMDFMEKALEGRSLEYFPVCPDMVRVKVHPVTGERLSDKDRTGTWALFVKGTEPK